MRVIVDKRRYVLVKDEYGECVNCALVGMGKCPHSKYKDKDNLPLCILEDGYFVLDREMSANTRII